MGRDDAAREAPVMYEDPGPLARHDRPITWIVFCIALLLRAAYLKQLVGSPLWEDLPVDLGYYREWALRIAGGDWVGTGLFEWSPFYAYYLAIVFKIFGTGLMAPRLIQILVGSLTCVLIYKTGRQVFSPGAGLAAGLMAAMYGPFLFYDGMLMKEVFTVFFVTAMMYQIVLASGSQRGLIATSGLCLGLGALVRDNVILLAPAVAAWLVVDPWLGGVRLARDRLRESAGRFFAFGFGLLLVLGPLAVRNHHVSGEIVLLRAGGGENLYIGNNAGADGHYVPPPFLRAAGGNELEDFRAEAARRMGRPAGAVTPAESSDYWRRQALGWIAAHPIEWLRLSGAKLLLFLNHYELPDNQSYAHHRRLLPILQLPLLVFGLAAPLAAAGIALSAGRWRDLLPLYIVGLVYTASVMLFFVFGRFRLPIVPLLLLFAGHALAALPGVARARRFKAVGMAAAAGLACLSVTGLDLEKDPAHIGQGRSQLAQLLFRAGRVREADVESIASLGLLEAVYASAGGVTAGDGHGVAPPGDPGRPDLGASFYAVMEEAYLTRASILRALGKGDAAARWARHAAAARPGPTGSAAAGDAAEGLARDGREAARAGLFAEAAQRYGDAIAALGAGGDPLRRVRLMLRLAEAQHHAGQPHAALETVGRALAVTPDLPAADRADAAYGQAMILRSLGDHAAMRERLKDVLRLNPDHPRADWIREVLQP